jgi:hypothetical protein
MRDVRALWVLTGIEIAVGIGLAPLGEAISRVVEVVYLGNSLTMFIALFCGGSAAVLAHAISASGLVLYHGGRSDWPCLLGFLAVWLAPMLVHPRWPAPQLWLTRQVLSFRVHRSDSRAPYASAACLAPSGVPR